MNYTLIAHTEDSSYHDRCGDYISQPGQFETFFTTDKAELIEQWAAWDFSGNFDTLQLLLNGIPDNHLGDEDFAIWDELNIARGEAYEKLKKEKIERDANAALEKARELAAQAELKAKLQRLQDLDTLAALKKKLGVS